jgi:magnesium-transporting ATPase (P-type)
MDILCVDKTGTLTRNVMEVVEVLAMPGIESGRVLALAALASAEADQDPIDTAIRDASAKAGHAAAERVTRFVPFDPATKISEAFYIDRDGTADRIIKGAYEIVSRTAEVPPTAGALVDGLAGQGHRVIAVAAGPPSSLPDRSHRGERSAARGFRRAYPRPGEHGRADGHGDRRFRRDRRRHRRQGRHCRSCLSGGVPA